MAPPRPTTPAAPTHVAAVMPPAPPAAKLTGTATPVAGALPERKPEPAKLPETLPPAPKPVASSAAALPPPSHVAGPVPAPMPATPRQVAAAAQPSAEPPIQTSSAVRTTAMPPMTAPRNDTARASFVVTNVREDDVLNVRSGPSSDFDVVAALKPGSRGVAITGTCQSEWCPVRHESATGWVNSVYLADETVAVTPAALRAPARDTQPAPAAAKIPVTAYRGSPDAPRTCLTAAARALLQTIESRFGPVRVVSTCRAGATIAGTGRPSRHASGNAVDFDAGMRKAEILRWLIANHRAGGTMTYPEMDHIHVDIGPHFVSIAGGQQSASWRGNRGGRNSAQDDDD